MIDHSAGRLIGMPDKHLSTIVKHMGQYETAEIHGKKKVQVMPLMHTILLLHTWV